MVYDYYVYNSGGWYGSSDRDGQYGLLSSYVAPQVAISASLGNDANDLDATAEYSYTVETAVVPCTGECRTRLDLIEKNFGGKNMKDPYAARRLAPPRSLPSTRSRSCPLDPALRLHFTPHLPRLDQWSYHLN